MKDPQKIWQTLKNFEDPLNTKCPMSAQQTDIEHSINSTQLFIFQTQPVEPLSPLVLIHLRQLRCLVGCCREMHLSQGL